MTTGAHTSLEIWYTECEDAAYSSPAYTYITCQGYKKTRLLNARPWDAGPPDSPSDLQRTTSQIICTIPISDVMNMPSINPLCITVVDWCAFPGSHHPWFTFPYLKSGWLCSNIILQLGWILWVATFLETLGSLPNLPTASLSRSSFHHQTTPTIHLIRKTRGAALIPPVYSNVRHWEHI